MAPKIASNCPGHFALHMCGYWESVRRDSSADNHRAHRPRAELVPAHLIAHQGMRDCVHSKTAPGRGVNPGFAVCSFS